MLAYCEKQHSVGTERSRKSRASPLHEVQDYRSCIRNEAGGARFERAPVLEGLLEALLCPAPERLSAAAFPSVPLRLAQPLTDAFAGYIVAPFIATFTPKVCTRATAMPHLSSPHKEPVFMESERQFQIGRVRRKGSFFATLNLMIARKGLFDSQTQGPQEVSALHRVRSCASLACVGPLAASREKVGRSQRSKC